MTDDRKLLDASAPLLEEMADTLETAARSFRCIVLLIGANVDPDKIAPHLDTAGAALSSMLALQQRFNALYRGES